MSSFLFYTSICFISFLSGIDSTYDVGTNIPLLVSNLRRGSIEDAGYYIQIAAASNCPTAVLSPWSCRTCPKNVEVFTFLSNKLLETFGFVATDPVRQEIIVAYRGSVNLKNFIEDFLLVPVPLPEDPNVRVHAGFHLTSLSLWVQTVRALRTVIQRFPTYKVVLTGHSLGGAIAGITTFKLLSLNLFPTAKYQLFTYGAPRQGNLAYATKFNFWNIQSVRAVHYADSVPHLPPSAIGYFHTQNELWINKRGTSEAVYCSTRVYEDPACSNSLGPKYNSSDHGSYFGTVFDASMCEVGNN